MKKEDVISYLKILGGLLLVFPFVHTFFALDYGLVIGGVITFCMYVVLMLIAIPMYNYLEHGKFWYWVSNSYRESKKQLNQNELIFSRSRSSKKW